MRAPCCPLVPLNLALRLVLRKGVTAFPLRSNPVTPFLDPPHHRCVGRARRRASGGNERAAGLPEETSESMVGCEVAGRTSRGCVPHLIDLEIVEPEPMQWPCEGSRACDLPAKPMRGRQCEASTAAPRGACGGVYFMAVGSLVRQSTPWGRASLPLGAVDTRAPRPEHRRFPTRRIRLFGGRSARLTFREPMREPERATSDPADDPAQAAPGAEPRRPVAMRLDPADIEQIARRVVDLMAATPSQEAPAGQFVDAAQLAKLLGVTRDWVYTHANVLGAIRLGGPQGRLRFDLQRVREAWPAPDARGAQTATRRPRRRRSQPRRAALIPYGSERATMAISAGSNGSA